ncbi:MAG: hypothetical protein H0V17_27800 [Deltaproteobacteria bacterium]|nr:hypothetical protein [Deltaproteobacteria bacterium]
MRSLLVLLVPALGGCPPPTRYLITDVHAARAPVADALVAADCGRDYGEPALRTDATGRARLRVRGEVAASKCTVIIAKDGFPTIEAAGIQLCTTPLCPALVIDLVAPYASEVRREPFLHREYATAPRKVAR